MPVISDSQHFSLLRPIRQTAPSVHGTSNSQRDSGSASGGGSVGTGGGGGTGGGTGGDEALATAQQALLTANAALAIAQSALQPGDVAEEVFDGTRIDLQDRDGTLGTTSGTLLFGTKSEDDPTARPVRSTDQGLVVDQYETYKILVDISAALEIIRQKLGDR